VLLDDALVTLNRAFGVLRRRNVPIEGLALHPSGTAGEARLTFVLKADAVIADRVAQPIPVGERSGKLVQTRHGISTKSYNTPSRRLRWA